MISISVVIPALNEKAAIVPLLRSLVAELPHEILVADGGSRDETAARAADWAKVIPSPRGRARQMNHAARVASGDVLLFLHADVLPDPGALDAIRRALAEPAVLGGNFRVCYEGEDAAAAAFNWINRQRCRFGIFYGDSGIFCRRLVFEQLGGYRDMPILEDYDFARRLWKHGRLAFLAHRIRVSDRRWRKSGLLVTLWRWFWIQALYLAGAPPDRLASLYRDVR